jgi:aspartyl/glutamyl-tRNA(Asn/Gln) amidotransferase C subunit
MISKKEVQKIANLARIKLNKKEEDLFSDQLNNIVKNIDQLQEVKDIAEFKNDTVAEWGVDKVDNTTDVDRNLLLEAASDSYEDYVRTKKVL